MTTYPLFYLDAPKTAQALNLSVLESLETFLVAAEKKRAPGVIIASRGERTFSSGGDLKAFKKLKAKPAGLSLNRKMTALLEGYKNKSLLLVMAVEGDVFGGGCEFILSGDFIIASETARFAFRQIQQGLTPGWGGAKRLLRRVGPGAALDWLTSGRLVPAQEALQSGLIDQHVIRGTAIKRADEFITARAEVPHALLKSIKGLIASGGAGEERVFARHWWSPTHRSALDKALKKR